MNENDRNNRQRFNLYTKRIKIVENKEQQKEKEKKLITEKEKEMKKLTFKTKEYTREDF